MTENNLTYEIEETSNENSKNNSNINNIIENENYFSDMNDEFKEHFFFFDEDNFLAQQIDYSENYNIKMLHHIANYYNIPKRKLKKDEITQLIIEFENNNENYEIVYNRKRLWHYLNELKQDKYFSKFVIWNN